MIAKIMKVLKNLFGNGTKIHYKEIAVPELEWHQATLQNGWTGNLYYTKNVLGQAMVRAVSLNPGTSAHRTVITSLPAGYKPINSASTGVLVNAGNLAPYGLMVGLLIDNNGDMRIVDPLASAVNGASNPLLAFQIIYITA